MVLRTLFAITILYYVMCIYSDHFILSSSGGLDSSFFYLNSSIRYIHTTYLYDYNMEMGYIIYSGK